MKSKSKSTKSEDISYLLSVFDPKRTLLLHIQIVKCFKSLQQLINKELT
jgi:hypothetical protein